MQYQNKEFKHIKILDSFYLFFGAFWYDEELVDEKFLASFW